MCYKWRLTLRPATAKPPGQLPYGYFHSPGLATNCEPSVTCAATKTRAQKIQKKAKENTVKRKRERGGRVLQTTCKQLGIFSSDILAYGPRPA